uniref:Acetylcholinesterase n=1 Tax=Parastrongyloides trichosuri TaxID=131310 RepID=A0A0N4Z6C3_PARTI
MYGRTSEEGSYFMPFMLGYEYGCGYNYSFNATDPQNQCLNITGATVFLAWFKLGNFYSLDYIEDAELGLAYLLNDEKKCETSNDTFTAKELETKLYLSQVTNYIPFLSSKKNQTNSPLDETTKQRLDNCSQCGNREKMISEIGDFLFNCDNINFANKSNVNDTYSETYVFEFRKRSTVNPWPQWMGAMHGYELEYVFGLPFRNTSIYNQSILEEEQKYADKIMEIFGNFSKYGHFNSTWEPYKKSGSTTLNNTYCAILDKNLTNDNYQLQYTDVLTSKYDNFATESASLDAYNDSVLTLQQKTIIITLNYKVDLLNLHTSIRIVTSKIYENIASFRGIFKKRTLFGQSAGAAFVTMHPLYDASHNYFKRIIVNSGAITNVWTTVQQKVALNNTLWLASITNCTKDINLEDIKSDDKTKIIKCMRDVDPDALNDNQFTTRDVEQPPLPYTFLPIYEDSVFFKGNLFDKLKKGQVKKNVQALFGRTSEEGSYFLPCLLGKDYGCGFNHSLSSSRS